jgi:hypothetical protein
MVQLLASGKLNHAKPEEEGYRKEAKDNYSEKFNKRSIIKIRY